MTEKANSCAKIPPAEKMELIRGMKLGKGFYGEVHEAFPKGPRPIMTVKSARAEKASSLISERYFLQKLASVPGVLPCLGGGYSDSVPKTYNLLLEYSPYGSLSEYIRLCGKGAGIGIDESFVRFLTREILKTLASIHRLGVVHCDVKPGNILIFEDLKPKLTNFGSAVEMVEYGRVSPAVDVWALGCTVLEMATGDEHSEIPEWMCDEGKDFLRLCFEKRSDRRPSAETLLQHPFVGGAGLAKKKKNDFRGCLFLPRLKFDRNSYWCVIMRVCMYWFHGGNVLRSHRR